MGKVIGLIVSILMLLGGIVLVACGVGLGLLLLVVGLMGTVMMGIILGSAGGSYADIFTPRGFFDAFQKTKVEKKNENASIWDQMTEKK